MEYNEKHTQTGSFTVRSENSTMGSEDGMVMLILQQVVLFPFALTPIFIDNDEEKALVRKALEGNRMVAAFPEIPRNQKEYTAQHPDATLPFVPFDGYKIAPIGCKCRIVKVMTLGDGTLRVLLRGLGRIHYNKIFNIGRPTYFKDASDELGDETLVTASCLEVTRLFGNLSGLMANFPDELRASVTNLTDPARVVDLVADTMAFLTGEKIWMLGELCVEKRARYLIEILNREVETMQLAAKIQSEVQQAMSQNQREFYLREQLRVIKDELKEDSRNPDIIDIEARMKKNKLPEKVEATVKKELSRLELIPTMSPDYHVSYNYIDWLLSVPWNVRSEDNLDLKRAREVLDSDHYGLEDVKKRILEFLAVMKLNPDRKAPILCLVGPPGVGKTSLGESIARATNRKFVRMALGGVRDEAEIRGHRRTYIGALPGRIIRNLKSCGVSNPVFMLDEIDKLASDQRGDPASALLEVLDPAQNKHFNDHYLELDCDLSQVFFIATANVLDTIPDALKDRMEIIRLPGYTNFEKREIARRYLAPRQLRENGLNPMQVKVSMPAIDEIIDYYTREAGVRLLEQKIAAVCRRIARRVVEDELELGKRYTITPKITREALGARCYIVDEAAKVPAIGSATGMAWTSVGGVILTVETLMMPGKGELKLTGRLGDVMRESAEAVFSLMKSRAEQYGIAPDVFEKHAFHIHVPDGATPKDGPSAGITITSALYSLLTNQPMKSGIAMTGEVNLRGQVTAIGGLKEKVIAALRAGVKTIVMPEENLKDLEEIPENVRSQLEFKPVADIDRALGIIFAKKGVRA